MTGVRWDDLLDPTVDEVHRVLPEVVPDEVVELLLSDPRRRDEPRPFLAGAGTCVYGTLVVFRALRGEDRVFAQRVDLVLTHDHVITLRWTPPGGDPPYDASELRALCPDGCDKPAGMVAYHLIDDVAEAFLNLIDRLDEEVDELEDHIDELDAFTVRDRVKHLRHDMLQIRQSLSPTRDAVHRVSDNRIDLDGPRGQLFPRDIELHFADAYDKLLRATDNLEIIRELLAGVRDYHQGKVAHDQNEVTKRLTVIASLLLFPTLIAGIYGQNFDHMPELHWRLGYGFSWALIVGSTIGQLLWFRYKKWI